MEDQNKPTDIADANVINEAKSPDEETMKNEPVCENVDKLTALEMLQLLKEYKKREFLYIAEITSLQKELFILSNGNYTATERPANIPVTPYYPVLDLCQVALYDPAINLEIKALRSKLYEQAMELRKTQDELKAATYTSESVMGRRLINKCKSLQEENTDIGKMLLENQLQPLQIQTNVLEKQLAFFKQQLKLLHEMNADLDNENERLTRQVQELTVLYKNVQQERDAANAKLEKLVEKKPATKERQSSSYRRSSSRDSHKNRKSGGDSSRHHNKSSPKRENSRRSNRHTSRRDIDFIKRNDKRKSSDM